ncbi:MAG: Nif3-like dinuclear metal center hexameric protein [Spirosomataceae bacterium]
MTIKNITTSLEQWAALSYQESYDNAGLIVGDSNQLVTGVLISLDCIEEVIDEAIRRGCNLVVAHHPIVFRGMKKLNGKSYTERTVIKAIKNDVAIYATHTNLDNVWGGVNFKIAEILGLGKLQILAPKKQVIAKLTVFVPKEYSQAVLDALFEAGAGHIGNYEHCSFRVEGTGSFSAKLGANPFIGEVGEIEKVIEDRIEVVFPVHAERRVVNAMKKAHPYEVPAFYLHVLENENLEVGAGVVGELTQELDERDFLAFLKEAMNLPLIRHTALLGARVKKVAVCGGAGSFLLSDAVASGADVFVTADYKYHEFFDADGRIIICDIGHYESEVFTKALIHTYLTKKFTNFAVLLSETSTNPVRYYI